MLVDYIIVGQGIAGSILAYQLIRRNRHIVVVDQGYTNSSSDVAVGLFNPFTGRKFTKTWNAEVIFPFLHQFYPEMERDLDEQFFFPCPIFRPFRNIVEQNDWIGKSSNNAYKMFVHSIERSGQLQDVYCEHGGVTTKMSGFVRTEKLLSASRRYIDQMAHLKEEQFDHDAIEYFEDHVVYKGIRARKIIFCSGHVASSEGAFTWLPFRPVNGEVLYLSSGVNNEAVYNRGCFITPKLDGLHRCGSTYNWRDLSTVPTAAARAEILGKLQSLVKWDVAVHDQKAGIRPATADRRPIIGQHPVKDKLIIFNGLGTKGVSLAPYYAGQLIKCLEEGKNLDKEVNIERYYSLYFSNS